MEVIGWKPLDLIVGGMLTAGVAFGVYKFSLTKRVGATVQVGDLDTTNLQECIALAGRPSELEVSVLPQSDEECRRLAASLRESMQASYSAEENVLQNGREDVGAYRRSLQYRRQSADTSRDLSQLLDDDSARPSPDRSPPKRIRFHPEQFSTPLMVPTTPPQLTRQLQSYRDTLDKWTADSEAKLEKLEQQRMALATELHVTREALHAERRHRAEAEQQRHRIELELKELEARLQKFIEEQEEMARREKEVGRLEQQVRDMEEQLEGLYQHNIVTPRQAMQENIAQQQQLSSSLQRAEEELQQQRQDLQEMENDVINLSAQLNKARKDARQLGDDNTALQKQLQAAQRAARDMVALLYERSAGKEGMCSEELNELLNASDSDLPLDELLQSLIDLLRHSA